MRLAILSDIHGNYDALKAVLEECKKHKIEQYLCLGDYVGYYYEPKKVWDLIYSLNGVKIKGNHEDLLKDSLSSRIIRNQIKEKYGTGHQVAQNQLSCEQINQLYNLPEKKLVQIGEYTFELNHGSPWDQSIYLYPDTAPEILEKANNPAIDIVLVGHSHYPFTKKLTHSVIINPGSVGQNRQKGGVACWAFINSDTLEYKLMRTSYDTEALFNEAKEKDPLNAYNYNILKR